MNEYIFFSDDRLCGLKLTQSEIDQILSLCIKANDNETGGILVGFYNENLDCAIITDASEPPEDSSCKKNSFYRGILGLASWLISLWKSQQRSYYLGEWHFHPFSIPSASGRDEAQMKAISEDISYNCPEPLLIIIGGDPRSTWDIKAYVYIQQHGLRQIKPSSL